MGALQIITPLIARHNVYNILAAVAVGLAVTVDGEPIPLKVLTFYFFSSAVHGLYPLTGKVSVNIFGTSVLCFPKTTCSVSSVLLWALAQSLPLRAHLSPKLLCKISISS